ncbi:MAG: hypothetical protein BWY49_00845 [Candidatus Omnitrophica bacterium ADurb.Bin314]|jgi:hypothetical protein|nr:MAG: hypothetical protein BWY49_00845 [Candidatus Omnitrophica bacterium ADurb.Bin314]
MEKSLRALAACVCLLVLAPLSLRAQPPVRESAAFEQYLKKPKGEFAKLVCLLNYYRTGDFTVRFDGFDYTPSFAFPHAKAWLFTHYNKENAAQWVRKHCYLSPFERKVIYVKFPGYDYEVARDMILRDLAELEQAIAETRSHR